MLLTEAPDGGWGLHGQAHTNADLVTAARAELAALCRPEGLTAFVRLVGRRDWTATGSAAPVSAGRAALQAWSAVNLGQIRCSEDRTLDVLFATFVTGFVVDESQVPRRVQDGHSLAAAARRSASNSSTKELEPGTPRAGARRSANASAGRSRTITDPSTCRCSRSPVARPGHNGYRRGSPSVPVYHDQHRVHGPTVPRVANMARTSDLVIRTGSHHVLDDRSRWTPRRWRSHEERRGRRRGRRSASGLDSPPLPGSTSVLGSGETVPGLTVLTVTPDPATLSARFLAAMISAALRTEPVTLPVR